MTALAIIPNGCEFWLTPLAYSLEGTLWGAGRFESKNRGRR